MLELQTSKFTGILLC